jgi:SUMO ligase MMS21 Smc5/6 complex component
MVMMFFFRLLNECYNDDVDVGKHPYTLSFEEQLARLDGQRGPAMATNDDNDDEDLTATQVEDTLLDPLTKRPLKDPVINRRCGHRYERGTMLDLLKTNPKTRCPMPGCPVRDQVDPNDLVADPNTRNKIRQRQLRAKK